MDWMTVTYSAPQVLLCEPISFIVGMAMVAATTITSGFQYAAASNAQAQQKKAMEEKKKQQDILLRQQQQEGIASQQAKAKEMAAIQQEAAKGGAGSRGVKLAAPKGGTILTSPLGRVEQPQVASKTLLGM